MSLISCPECGRSISDQAVECPSCGFPILKAEKLSKTAVIQFHWDTMKGNTWLKTTVVLDGIEIAQMRCSEKFDYETSVGTHNIQLFFRNNCVVNENIEILSGQKSFYYVFKQSLFTLKRTHAYGDAESRKNGRGESNQHHPSEAAYRQDPRPNIPRCPTCGSEKIAKLSMSRKVFSANMIGIASASAGKTFKCKNCGYMW